MEEMSAIRFGGKAFEGNWGDTYAMHSLFFYKLPYVNYELLLIYNYGNWLGFFFVKNIVQLLDINKILKNFHEAVHHQAD